MSARLWKRQLTTLKAHVGLGEVELSAVFVRMVDSSVPSDDQAEDGPDYSAAALIGYRSTVGGQHFARLPAEPLAKFQKRIQKASPDTRVFWPCYLGGA